MVDTLLIKVKQGEELSLGFSIKEGGVPMDISEYDIEFIVRRSPVEESKPIISKIINTSSDEYTDGIMTFPNEGKFKVHLTKEDTSSPVDKYYVSVALVRDHLVDIISSSCCSSGLFYICNK